MIRPATHADIPFLGPALMSFFDAVDLASTGLIPDSDTVEFFVQDAIDCEDRCFLVAECDGKIIGGITGIVTPWMFNANILMLVEVGWFVLPEYRRKYPVAAFGLKKRLEKWGREMGATVISMSSTKRDESPRVIQMYEKSGLRHLDSNYIGRL